MRPTPRLLSCVLLAALSLPLGAQRHGEKARRTIDAANTEFITLFNKGDVAGFANVYTPDAVVMPSNSPAIRGRPAIEQFWQGGYKAGIRNVRLATSELDVHGKSATEVGSYEFDIQPSTGATMHDKGKYIVLWKRTAKGEWRWHRDIFNSDMPLPGAPAPAK